LGERRAPGREAVKTLAGIAIIASAVSSACGSPPFPVCAPHDALCQTQMAAMGDPSCKNGKGSNAKCLDPRAP
jgi:hypothetical protein